MQKRKEYKIIHKSKKNKRLFTFNAIAMICDTIVLRLLK